MSDPGKPPECSHPKEIAGHDPVAGVLERILLDLPPGRPSARVVLLRLVARLGFRFAPAHGRRIERALRLARLVESAHDTEPECPRGVSEHLVLLALSLRVHRQREEEILAEAVEGRTGSPSRLEDLRADHAAIDQHLIRLAVLTHDFTPPLGADRDWRALSKLCRDIDRDLREQMRLEGEVVFPWLDDRDRANHAVANDDVVLTRKAGR